MFKFLFRPSIRAKFSFGRGKINVDIISSTPDQTMILLFTLMKHVAVSLKMEPRQLMNKVIDLDKTIIRNTKKSVKKYK